MAVTNIPISKQGYKRLEEELARLKSERPAIIQAIKEAREEGDLRENAGYDAARERQGMAEARIKYIESRMALYQVVDLDKLSGDKVIFGSTVEVEDVDTEESRTYTILGPDEAEPAKGSISFLSPVGQALLGKEVGDEVSVDIPRGRVTYEIVDITFRGSSIFDEPLAPEHHQALLHPCTGLFFGFCPAVVPLPTGNLAAPAPRAILAQTHSAA